MSRRQLDCLERTLTERDRAVLESVASYGLLRTTHLQQLHFSAHATPDGAARICRRVLKRLSEHRLIEAIERLVEVLGRYSKLDPFKTFPPAKRVRSPNATQPHVHSARRRLGTDTIASLVGDYQLGESTTALMRTYGIGKGTVLRLLRESGVQVRRPGPQSR